MDNPFAPRFDQRDEPHPKQIAYEDERVRLVLRRFGLSARIPEMMGQFQEKWGKKWLTFETFHELFPSFPILLEGHSFYHVAENCRPVKLFRSFEETFFLRHYLDVYARGREEALGRPIGMVFRFDGFQGGLVMHNGKFDTLGTKMIHALPDDAPPHRVVVEPFIPLINHLARSGWTPDMPLRARPKTHKPKLRQGIMLRPWMVRLLGCGPDTVILAFLWNVLRSPLAHDRLLVRRLEGVCHVAIDQESLAERTGLSKRQVKSGIESLRSKGYIMTAARQDHGKIKTHFRVDRKAIQADMSGLNATT